jgi:lipoyl(octanoyl) transferase
MAYPAVHGLQIELAAQRRQGGQATDLFLAVEHPPVFTLGRRGGREHLGVSEAFLRQRGIAVVPIERGGEITYHGPGQLVLYPILDLRRARLAVSDYVHLLEDLMLRLAEDCGVVAGRDPRNHGIWVGNSKLGSIGIAIRHGVAFHGLALNVDLDLEPFAWINPCGLRDVGMTSLAREGGADCTMDRLKARLPHHLAALFGVALQPLARDRLLADFPSAPLQP